MKRKVDVLIIGGGVIGICSAFYLSGRGRQVTVVEQGEICSGSSYGNAGLIVPSHSIPLARPGVLSRGFKWLFNPESPFYIKPRLDIRLLSWLWKFYRACNNIHQMQRGMQAIHELSLASLSLYRELSEQGDLDFSFGHHGLLVLCKSEKNLEAVIDEARQMEELGFAGRILNPAEAQNLTPGIGLDVKGGVYFPQDAHIIPQQFVFELARNAEKKGAVIRSSTGVVGFEFSGNRITSVRTTKGDFVPNEVVLASGAWSPHILRSLRIKLPVQPAKGYSLTVKRPVNFPEIPLLLSEAKVIATPMGETLRFGGTLELAGLDLSINNRRLKAITKAVPEYLPELDIEQFDFPEIWSGLRPCTPDGLPFIGRSAKFENLIIAAGHGMLGISLGPITGDLVSLLVEKEPPAYDLRPFEVERFS